MGPHRIRMVPRVHGLNRGRRVDKPHLSDAPSARAVRLRVALASWSLPDRLGISWLVGLALVAAVCRPARPMLVVVAILVAASVAIVAAWGARSRIGRVVQDFSPIAVIYAVFSLTGPIVAAANPARWDAPLAAVDQRLFGGLADAWRGVLGRPSWLTDAASVAYVSFYFVPLAIAVALHRQRRRSEFESFVFTLMVAFFLPFAGYLLLPATGPRVPLADEAHVLGGGIVANVVRAVLRAGETNRVDAFPSGHATVSLVFLVAGARSFSRWRVPLAACVIAILFSTVYLSLHYVVDLLAGAVVAAIVPVVAPWLRRALGSDVGVSGGPPSAARHQPPWHARCVTLGHEGLRCSTSNRNDCTGSAPPSWPI